MIQHNFSNSSHSTEFKSFSQVQFSLSGYLVAHPLQLLSNAVKVLVKDDLCGGACTHLLVLLYLSCHVNCCASILSYMWMLIGTGFVLLHVLIETPRLFCILSVCY